MLAPLGDIGLSYALNNKKQFNHRQDTYLPVPLRSCSSSSVVGELFTPAIKLQMTEQRKIISLCLQRILASYYPSRKCNKIFSI